MGQFFSKKKRKYNVLSEKLDEVDKKYQTFDSLHTQTNESIRFVATELNKQIGIQKIENARLIQTVQRLENYIGANSSHFEARIINLEKRVIAKEQPPISRPIQI
jgi:hypothetical protein